METLEGGKVDEAIWTFVIKKVEGGPWGGWNIEKVTFEDNEPPALTTLRPRTFSGGSFSSLAGDESPALTTSRPTFSED